MLKKGKNRKNWAAWLLAAALAGTLAVCGLGGMKAAAVKTDALETDKECSLTVQMADTKASGTLREGEFPVKLYKVASVIGEGNPFTYTPMEGFQDLALTTLTDGGDAEDWIAQADKAYEIISESAQGSFTPLEFSFLSDKSEGKKEALDTGLYLMVIDSQYNRDGTKQYVFSPTLVPLPLTAAEEDGSVQYEYDPIVSLKYDVNPLYGNLVITKRLMDSVSEYLPVSFVFHVTAVDDAGNKLMDKNGNAVYDNYVHAEFTASGEKSIVIEGFPAGIKVKVEEAYSGAGYQLVAGVENQQTVTIVAEELVKDAGTEETTAAVTFSNQYDDGKTGGYGVTNHYEYDGNGGWSITKPGLQAGDNTSGSGTANEVWQEPEGADDDEADGTDTEDITGSETEETGTDSGNGTGTGGDA